MTGRHPVACPPVWVCLAFFSWWDWGDGVGEEDCRGRCPSCVCHVLSGVHDGLGQSHAHLVRVGSAASPPLPLACLLPGSRCLSPARPQLCLSGLGCETSPPFSQEVVPGLASSSRWENNGERESPPAPALEGRRAPILGSTVIFMLLKQQAAF